MTADRTWDVAAAAEAVRDAPGGKALRHATVRYRPRLTPGKSSPLLVVLSARGVADPGHGVNQVKRAGVVVDPAVLVEIEPVLAGCTCACGSARCDR